MTQMQLTPGATIAATPALTTLPTTDRFSARGAKVRASGNASRAAWLLLLTQEDGMRALLFNAEQRYLAEVIDDPLTVEHLCAAGRPCVAPPGLLLDKAVPRDTTVDIRCWSLGHH